MKQLNFYEDIRANRPQLTREERREAIESIRLLLSSYEQDDRDADDEEEKKRLEERERRKQEKAANRLDKQISVNFPIWVYEALEKELVPLMKEKVEPQRTEFTVSHAMRYLGYYALKYPGFLKGVSLAELKDLYREDPS